jgi:hypothetical protein
MHDPGPQHIRTPPRVQRGLWKVSQREVVPTNRVRKAAGPGTDTVHVIKQVIPTNRVRIAAGPEIDKAHIVNKMEPKIIFFPHHGNDNGQTPATEERARNARPLRL